MQMSEERYRQMILNGIQNLPPYLLAQAADFVYFIRKRAEQPDAFTDLLYKELLESELSHLNEAE